jgi:hypothetical protein
MREFDPRRLLALLFTALCLAGAGPSALAAKKAPPASPQITGFEMEPADKVAPGAELFFRVEGTPGSRATVRVGGVTRTLVLQEVDDGVYEGSYTLRPSDKVNAGSAATATLRRNGRSSFSTMTRLNAAPPPAVAAAPQPAPQPQAQRALVVNRFVARPVDKLDPGTELRFFAEGTPGAKATFTIENVAANVPMREVAPGRYEGTYTLRRLDRINAGVPVVATLEANGQTVRSPLTRNQMLVDARPPTIKNQHPRDNETVQAAGPVSVSGTFDDAGGVGIDPQSVKIMLSGRDVTPQASVTRDFFTYRGELAPGQYVADVTGKDAAGNPVRSTWSFNVVQQPTAAVGIPLAITSHTPNAAVPPGAPVTIRGHTAPYATVHAEVLGVASVVGMVGVVQKLYDDRITADANGNFQFDIAPQMPVPGMRYEVNLKATANNQTKDTRLVLFQQR